MLDRTADLRRAAERCRTFRVTHICARTRTHAHTRKSRRERFGRFGRFGSRRTGCEHAAKERNRRKRQRLCRSNFAPSHSITPLPRQPAPQRRRRRRRGRVAHGVRLPPADRRRHRGRDRRRPHAVEGGQEARPDAGAGPRRDRPHARADPRLPHRRQPNGHDRRLGLRPAADRARRRCKDANFDLGLLGFDRRRTARADRATSVDDGLSDPDEVPEPPAEPITQPGDLWLLGDHRLLCGD